MPAMVDPFGARPFAGPREPNLNVASHGRAGSMRLRIRTAVHRAELTRALAEGVDPDKTSELALRARMLTRPRNRRALARSLRRTLGEAQKPALTRVRLSIIDRRAVLDAEGEITEMIERLNGPSPVRAQGMALLERLLTNADRSPLYNTAGQGKLRRAIRVADGALDAHPAQSHEFDLRV
jgi:hypothetical protein